MQSAFVSDENYRDQNKHYDENHALFAFGEFKNSKQGLHRSVAHFRHSFWSTVVIKSPAGCHSERREESQSYLFTITEANTRDVSSLRIKLRLGRRFASHDRIVLNIDRGALSVQR